MMKPLLFLVMSLGITFSSLAADYVAPFDEVTWKAVKQADFCSLSVEDVYSGLEIRFEILGGQPMTLKVQGRSAKTFSDQVFIETVPPVWGNNEYETTSIDEVQKTKEGLLVVHGAALLFRDIQGGAWISVKDLFHSVTLPTANIHSALKVFRTCTAALPSMHFEEAQNTVLEFKSGELALNQEQRDKIKAISELVIADPNIIKVLITGHTDNIGDAVTNLSVSKRRASDAAYWMVLAGVDESMIEVRGQGERYPIASNQTAEGQQKNRRIEIELVKK